MPSKSTIEDVSSSNSLSQKIKKSSIVELHPLNQVREMIINEEGEQVHTDSICQHSDTGKSHSASSVPADNDDSVKLKRKITLVNGTALVIGTIIGSGIFVSPKGVFENAGNNVYLALAIWSFCGFFSMIGALCFSELGTTITRSGGEYAYVLEAFGPGPAFLNLWIQLLVIRPTTQAISSLTFAVYLTSPFFEDCEPHPLLLRMVAASCLLLLTYINGRSVRWAMNVQDIFTAAKLLALIVIILSGLTHIVKEGKTFLPSDSSSTSSSVSSISSNVGLSHLAHSFYSGLFAFGGWNYINVVTEELKNPYKNLPRAAMSGILIVTVVYVLANIAYFSVLTPEEIVSSPAVVTIFTEKVLPASAKWFLPIAVAVSTFGGLNGILFTTARLFYVASQEGQVPPLMGMISLSRSTPTPSLIVSCIMSCLMLVTSDVYQLINYFSFTLWLWTGIATAALVHLRITRPEMKRPIRFPLLLPISFTAGCLVLTLFAIWAEPVNAAYGSALMFLGIPVYFGQKWFCGGRSTPKSDSLMMRFTVWMQKLLLVTYPDAAGDESEGLVVTDSNGRAKMSEETTNNHHPHSRCRTTQQLTQL